MRIKFITKKGVTRCVHCLDLAKRDEKGRLISCDHGKSEKK